MADGGYHQSVARKVTRGPLVQMRVALATVDLGDVQGGLRRLHKLGAVWMNDEDARAAGALYEFLFFTMPNVRDSFPGRDGPGDKPLRDIEYVRTKLRDMAKSVREVHTRSNVLAILHEHAEMLWNVRGEPYETCEAVAGNILRSMGRIEPPFAKVDPRIAGARAQQAGSPATLAAQLAGLAGFTTSNGKPYTAKAILRAVKRTPQLPQLSKPSSRKR